jgi:Ca2+/Na+ antiporter
VYVSRREAADPAEAPAATVARAAGRQSTVGGDRDVAVGNLIGSSIDNVVAVLGLTVVVAPHGVPVPDEVLAADLGPLVVVTAAAVPVFVSGPGSLASRVGCSSRATSGTWRGCS